jgi:hypothetical protein
LVNKDKGTDGLVPYLSSSSWFSREAEIKLNAFLSLAQGESELLVSPYGHFVSEKVARLFVGWKATWTAAL